MFFIFDLDDTLIKGYLVNRTCEVCRGEGKVYDVEALNAKIRCVKCSGRGHTLENVGYDNPLEWLPGVLGRLKMLLDDGHHIAIATNQTGVVHGYQTRQQVDAKMALVSRELHGHLGKFIPVYACMDLKCRKPAPDLLNTALSRTLWHRWETVFVGDMESDREAAHAAGVPFIFADKFFGSP